MSDSQAPGGAGPADDRLDILAVDGGNSKIDAALLSAGGEVLGAGRGGGASFSPGSEEPSLAALLDAVRAASADAGLDSSVRPVAGLAVLCLAGDDLPVDDLRLLQALQPLVLADELLLRNDTFAVLRAGSERTWGVGVVCGTGLNCAAVAPDGRAVRYASLGEISGDAGGGSWLGRQAVRAAVRGDDGRGPHTRLEQDVIARFELPSLLAVLEALHTGALEGRLPELAPVVFEAAAANDEAAQVLVDRQAQEVVAMVASAVRRLDLAAADVDVVLGGGLFKDERTGFLERVRKGIVAVAPAARVAPLAAPPVLGAALLGLDRLAAPPAAYAKLRSSLS